MFDTDLWGEVTRLHASAARIAAAIDTETSGPVADELLSELLAAARQLDLGTCRAVERVDRTGQVVGGRPVVDRRVRAAPDQRTR